MALAPGTRFGPYEIVEPIGAGGMGEVYRASDTSLKRDVAIKVLPESFAADAGRLARFQREAEVLAALNQPNIAHVYGLEKDDAATALVMELVEGLTLADRIEQGPLPSGEALNVAMQIADALEAAHARGIVHRDLKPANVKLRPDGTVKVLDFGIAKALDTQTGISGPQAPQLTTPAMTQAGLILGTAAYMAPEQARGLAVDERADIWAFGCVLYEMLTGQPAFGGEDVTITLARVVDRDTDLESLPATISPAVRQTIALCLQKDVRRRVADIRDVRLALEGAFEAPIGRGANGDGDATPGRGRLLPLTVGLVAGAVLVGLVGFSVWPEPEPRAVNRFAYTLPGDQEFAGFALRVIDLSPDGRTLIYSSVDGLRIRDMGTLEDRLIPTSDAGAEPTFSPDGRSVAYFSADPAIKRVATTGGAAVLVTNALSGISPSLFWAPDGAILYSDSAGIQRVPATGGTPEVLVPADGYILYGPRLLPSGDAVLYTRFSSGTVNSGQLVVQSLSTGEQTVIANGADGRYVPTGHVVYAFENSLFGIAFDARRLRVSGGAVPLVQGISRATGGGGTATAQFAIADNGTLAYVRGLGGLGAANTLVWVDRQGNEEPVAAPPRNYQYLELSPDGTRVALDIRDQEGDAWVWDLARETLQRLTFDPGQNRGAIWSPDSRRIAFSRQLGDTEEIYWQAADGSGTAQALTEGSGQPMFPVEITPDGTTLLYTKSNLPRDIFMVPVEGPAGPGTPLLAGDASEGSPTASPDGRWLAYSSDESGRYEIYVRPFPDVDSGRWQISAAGGIHPQWRPDGSELFYLSVDGPSVTMMAVPIESGPAFRPGSPAALFSGRYYYAATASGPDVYDVSADGQRFLMITQEPTDALRARPDIVIVQNWFEELKRLVPVD